MGDRAQVAIKDGEGKVYLYGHWIGADIFRDAARAIERAPTRRKDAEYLARIIFDEMKEGDSKGETGFGIGTRLHGDTEHFVAVLDCETETVSWEVPNIKRGKAPPAKATFDEFVTRALAGRLADF
jgi:hypothetical protein